MQTMTTSHIVEQIALPNVGRYLIDATMSNIVTVGYPEDTRTQIRVYANHTYDPNLDICETKVIPEIEYRNEDLFRPLLLDMWLTVSRAIYTDALYGTNET